jgi:hypothetical protein
MVRLRGLCAAIATLIATNAAYGQCSLVGGAQMQPGTLYLLYPGGALTPLRQAWPANRRNPDTKFMQGIRLVYAVVPRSDGLPTSGILAVRFVALASNGSQRQQSSRVYLQRDSVDTRRRTRPAWRGTVSSQRYYIFHNPNGSPAKDNVLRHDFHTNYVYIAGSPEQSTYTLERRSSFHFPEMKSVQSANPFAVLFGPSNFTAPPDARFEAQVKYYRPRAEQRCVVIEPRLESDDANLKITISDLDNQPDSKDWLIDWAVPTN